MHLYEINVYYLFLLCSFITTMYLTNINYYVTKYYSKGKTLVKLVKTQHRNMLMIFYICMKILVKRVYVSILQYFNNNVIRIDKNTYEISYVIGGNLYKMRTRIRKGCDVLLIQARDENGSDITNELQVYLGPNENFHGHKFTPSFFNATEITMSLANGEEITYNESDELNIQPHKQNKKRKAWEIEL